MKKRHNPTLQMLLFRTARLSDQPFMRMRSVWLATDPNRSVPSHVHGEWGLDLREVNFSKEAECQGRQARLGPLWPAVCQVLI